MRGKHTPQRAAFSARLLPGCHCITSVAIAFSDAEMLRGRSPEKLFDWSTVNMEPTILVISILSVFIVLVAVALGCSLSPRKKIQE